MHFYRIDTAASREYLNSVEAREVQHSWNDPSQNFVNCAVKQCCPTQAGVGCKFNWLPQSQPPKS